MVLFLCGDVMTGRGIDQALPHPGDPRLYEPYVRSAADYLRLAERSGAVIPKPVDFSYIWGDGLAELERAAPDWRIINLETSVTRSGAHWPGKEVHYRMSPDNFPCILAAGIDCCCLANNHVLDWGYDGLAETLQTIQAYGVRSAGAGLNRGEARRPAVLESAGKGRLIVLSCGEPGSGIPLSWRAAEDRPGVFRIPDLAEETARRIGAGLRQVKRPGDVALASLHWGGNWGYGISREQRLFARALIDAGGFDLVWGHSSHHVKGIEVYRDRPILYGCGDLINDYEGIEGYEAYRPELALMYFPEVDASSGSLRRLRLTPTRIKNFRLNRASREEAEWLRGTLNREGRGLGTRASLEEDGTLSLEWRPAQEEISAPLRS